MDWRSWQSASSTVARQCVEEPVLEIVDGRHPVLDILEPQGTFVPNDTVAGEGEGRS